MDFEPVGPEDHVRGPATAPVTLVEYGDFECPSCGYAYPILKDLQHTLGDGLRFVFRHFPVVTAHPHAQRAAEAAEWAATSGRFWEMHDWLYEHQDTLDDVHLVGAARELGLDPDGLVRAWADHTFVPRIKRDFLAGIGMGLQGTPSFFVDGVRYRGATERDELLAALRAA